MYKYFIMVISILAVFACTDFDYPYEKIDINTGTKNVNKIKTDVSSLPEKFKRKRTITGVRKKSINLNKAKQEDFEKLPGIGPAAAKRIIEYRNEQGGFSSLEDLLNVRGIGEKRLEQYRPYIFVE